jgi:hypothetical protein
MLGIPDFVIFGLAIVIALGATLYSFACMLKASPPRSGLYAACATSLVAAAMAMISTWVD